MKGLWASSSALILLSEIVSLTGTDGALDTQTLKCAPQFFVPFTFAGITRTLVSRGTQSTGFSHMAAAWMAMEHFNERDPSIVPELGDDLFQDCNFKFRLETNKTDGVPGAIFFDTASQGHQSSQLFYQSAQGMLGEPCAFVGPYHDETATNIATLAASIGVPHIPSGGQDMRLTESMLNPFTSVVSPRMMDMTSALGRFLTVHKRTNYIATLFGYTDIGTQFQEGIGIVLDVLNVTQRRNFGYVSSSLPIPVRGQKIRDAMDRIKESGYRTIIVTMDNDVYDLPVIADAAEECGLNTADYMWVILPPYQHESVQALIDLPDSIRRIVTPPVPYYDNVRKLLTGAALLQPVDGFQVDPEHDKFARAWRSVDETFVERLSSRATVISPTGVYSAGDYESSSVDYFQTYAPEPGSSYIYDATMTVGMGACIAERQLRMNGTESDYVSGLDQLAAIREVNFMGASGRVEFGVTMSLLGNNTSARLPAHMTIGVFNLFPPTRGTDGPEGAGESYVLAATYTDLIDREEIDAINNGADFADYLRVDEFRPFFFRDGAVTAPMPLRDPANQNFLSPGLRYFGLSMMGIALACCLAFGIWVFVYRNCRIVKAAQPQFLYLLIFGAALTSLSIFGISTDENWNFSAEQLGRHCMSIVWLASLGHIVTYGALFTKLWRVNKVLQFSRRQIDARHVAWPYALLKLAALTILTVWQVVDPLQWVRVELNEVTGDSIGQCDSETMTYFIVALATVMMIPSVLVCIMAYRTRDVDDQYSEHSWMFTLIVIQLQVIIVAIPLVIVLRDVSTDGKYIGFLMLLWSMPMSTILLIMLPKVVAHHKGMSGGVTRSERTRGSSGGVRVTGLPKSASMIDSSHRTSVGSQKNSNEPGRKSYEAKNTPLESPSEVEEFAEDCH